MGKKITSSSLMHEKDSPTAKNPKHRIHYHLKKAAPEAVHKAKKILGFKHPKLIFLTFFILLAYYLFTQPFMLDWITQLNRFSYFGVFLAGGLATFGFTAPFGIGFLLNFEPEFVFFAAIIGGIGGMVADLLIFRTIRFSFMDEIKDLEKTKVIKKIEHIVNNNKHILIKHYLLYIFAGIIISTPLPDELGVSILAGLTTIKPLKLAVLSFLLHTASIFALLNIPA